MPAGQHFSHGPGAWGRLLELRFAYPEMLWPYSGYLGVHITVKDEGRAFEGPASGEIVFTVVSPQQGSETESRRSTVRVPGRPGG